MNPRTAALTGSLAVLSLAAAQTPAGVVFGLGAGLTGGRRWDAAHRIVNINGINYERSLSGGLRFSLQGGSYTNYRNSFQWNVVPSVADFTNAINAAFNAWTAVDPATGLSAGFSFTADLTTPVRGAIGGVNANGAEIDLLAGPDGFFWDPGDTGLQGESFFAATAGAVTLTSGTTNYAGGGYITGADIRINNNPGAIYSLDIFRRLLTHELGHALGLGDVEGSINPGAFIDDNYDGSTSATALSTLTNSWALLVNPANPAASPLFRYTVPVGDPGTQTPGVDILMESFGLGLGPGNPETNLFPLTNDDYGTRQFLYPVPSPGVLFLLGLAALAPRRRAKA